MFFSPGNPGEVTGIFDDDGNFIESDKVLHYGYGLQFYGESSGFTPEEMMDKNLNINQASGQTLNIAYNSEGGGYTCGAVIALNGWKFPDGYPR